MSSPIPNLPPISGIQDPQVRAYLQALTNAWAVRNGQAGDGSERFLTVKDLQDGMRMAASGRGGTLGGSGTSITAPGVIAGLIQSLVDQVQQSRLWRLLGERIERIELPDWFRDRFGAEITTERILRETATSALANEITTITAAMGGSIAGVRREVNVVANATNALAEEVTQVVAQTNQNIALVDNRVKSVSDLASATASNVSTLQTTVNGVSTKAQQALSLAQSVDGQVDGAWTVKFDAAGYVTGAGLGISGKGGSYSSEFMVRADRFSIGAPVNPSAQWDADVPFIVTTTPTTVGGVTYPPGVWIKAAMIANASITNAKIGNAAITRAKIGLAEVDTLRIDGEAVTVPRVVFGSDLSGGVGTAGIVAAGGIDCGGGGLIIIAATNMRIPSDGAGTMELIVNGNVEHTQTLGGRVSGGDLQINMPAVVIHALPGPQAYVTVQVRLTVTGYAVNFTQNRLVLMGGKR